MTDTTKEAVERLATEADTYAGPRGKVAAATLRQLLTERDAANEKLASARDILGNLTHECETVLHEMPDKIGEFLSSAAETMRSLAAYLAQKEKKDA